MRIFNIFFVRIFKKMRTFFKHWENTKEKICFCADLKKKMIFLCGFKKKMIFFVRIFVWIFLMSEKTISLVFSQCLKKKVLPFWTQNGGGLKECYMWLIYAASILFVEIFTKLKSFCGNKTVFSVKLVRFFHFWFV